MAEKTADVPEEKLKPPSPAVAVPAMQGLSYSLDEPDLKEMYLNLLTVATDDRRSATAHPSFAEIIKQLSGDEAGLLSTLIRVPAQAIVQLRKISAQVEGYDLLRTHILPLINEKTNQPFEHPRAGMWIDNWQRLGLVTVDYDEYLTAPAAYDWAETRPETLALRAALQSDTVTVEVQKGLCRTTGFGQQFAAAVVPVRVPASTNDTAPADTSHLDAPHPSV